MSDKLLKIINEVIQDISREQVADMLNTITRMSADEAVAYLEADIARMKARLPDPSDQWLADIQKAEEEAE